MEEDVLGPREELVGDRYTRCTRCGNVVAKEETSLMRAEGGPVATQLEEICPECRRALESGEADWIAPELDETE